MVRHLVALLESVESRIDKLQRQVDALDPLPAIAGDPEELARNWTGLPLAQRRTLLRQLVQRIDVTPGPGIPLERLVITSVDD